MGVYFLCGEIVRPVVVRGKSMTSQGNGMCKGIMQKQAGGQRG